MPVEAGAGAEGGAGLDVRETFVSGPECLWRQVGVGSGGDAEVR